MSPAPGRGHPTDVLLCGHHFRTSRSALAAAGAAVFELGSAPAWWRGASNDIPGCPAAAHRGCFALGSLAVTGARPASSTGRAAVHAATSDATALSSLTARQLAGQRVIYSYPGLTPPASLLALIRDGEAAGVIFFGDNISRHAQIAAVIKTLETADATSATRSGRRCC